MRSFNTLIGLLMFVVFLSSCSESKEEMAEPGSVRAQAEQIGHEAAQMIQAPMNKAQRTVDQENDRIRELEERLNK